MNANRINSDVSEKRLYEKITQSLSDSSSIGISWKIQLLEELLSRLKRKQIVDMDEAFECLKYMANEFGEINIISSLIRSCLISLIEKDTNYFDRTLEELRKKHKTIQILSNLVMSLDYNKKREAVTILVDSLMNWGIEDHQGKETLYDNLLKLGTQNLANEIVRTSAPYLDSSVSKSETITYSLRLCSRFANKSQTPKMLELFEKAMDGHFGDRSLEIYKEITKFVERTHDSQFIFPLLKLSDDPISRQIKIFQAIANILKTNPNLVEYVIETLYDTNNEHRVEILILALERSKIKVDPKKLYKALYRGEKNKFPLGWRIGDILARNGENARPLLVELIKDNASYEFALETMKKIGINQEEIYSIFNFPPMLQLYNFFYRKSNRNPCDFNNILKGTEQLGNEIRGKKLTNLDFLIMNLFSCFNFITMQVDLSGKKGVDVLCFDSETMDILIIGCTTGTIKNDLKTMDALLNEMTDELPEILRNCRIIPLIFSTGTTNFVSSDVKDANQIGIILLAIDDINKIIEMLNTGKTRKDLLDYFERVRINQQPSENSYSY